MDSGVIGWPKNIRYNSFCDLTGASSRVWGCWIGFVWEKFECVILFAYVFAQRDDRCPVLLGFEGLEK